MPAARMRRRKFKAISEAYECLKDPQKRAAYDRFGHAAFATADGGGNGGGGRRISAPSPTFSTISSASSWAAPSRAAARRQRPARLGPALRSRDQARGRLSRPPGRAHRRHHRAAASPATARAPRPGTAAARLHDVRRPRPGARAQRLLRGRADLPDLPRRRRDDRRSLPVLPRRGPGREAQDAEGQHPRRRRRGHPHPPRRRRRGRRARRPAGRSLHLRPPRPARHLPARGHDPVRALPGQLHHRRAGRLHRGARASTGEVHEIKIPAGIQSGKQLRQRGAGMPVHERPRPWRHGDPGRGRDADQAERQAARDCSRPSARPRPARNARTRRASSRRSRRLGGWAG